MGKMSPGMRMLAVTQARRRRDERGRYMDGDQGGMDMQRGGYQYPRERRGMTMSKGEGYFAWDGAEPHLPPERYGQPESRYDGPVYGENVTDMRDWPRSHMSHSNAKNPTKIGFAQGNGEHDGEKLTMDKAEKWVKHMHNADGSMGGKWRMEEVRQVARNFGVQDGQDMIDFYAIINAMRSDYGEVARQFGVDKTDFYAAMAKAWLHDKDAVDNKAAMYYKCIVAKDEAE